MIRKTLFISFVLFFNISCVNEQKHLVEEIKTQSKKNAMDSDLVKNDINKKNEKQVEIKTAVDKAKGISGKVTFANHYCGGAPPSDEIIEAHKTQFKMSNSTIMLKNTKTKKSFMITTDNQGKFVSEIEPGIYDYYMTKSYNKSMGASFNASCPRWLNTCFGQINIKEGKTEGYKIVFEFLCNPCEPPRP